MTEPSYLQIPLGAHPQWLSHPLLISLCLPLNHSVHTPQLPRQAKTSAEAGGGSNFQPAHGWFWRSHGTRCVRAASRAHSLLQCLRPNPERNRLHAAVGRSPLRESRLSREGQGGAGFEPQGLPMHPCPGRSPRLAKHSGSSGLHTSVWNTQVYSSSLLSIGKGALSSLGVLSQFLQWKRSRPSLSPIGFGNVGYPSIHSFVHSFP